MKLAFVTGKNTVLEALKGKRKVFKVIIFKEYFQDEKISEIYKEAKKRGVTVELIGKERAFELGLRVKQGVAAELEEYPYEDFEKLVSIASSKDSALLVFLDNLEDPQNFGNIIRTAEFFGALGIVIRKKRSVQVTPVVERISQGASSYLKIARVANISQSLKKVKEAGFFVIGLDEKAEETLTPEKFSKKTALVLGGEDKGLSRLTKENCDLLLKLKGSGKTTSLNAASAFSAACYCYVLKLLYEKQGFNR